MVLLREVLISFRGNELFLNCFLILWLILVGLGSLISSQRIKAEALAKLISLYYFIAGISAVSLFLVIRLLPRILDFAAEVPNLSYSLVYLPLALAPTCLLLGIGFGWGNKYFYTDTTEPAGTIVNQAYLFETLGFFAAGLAFNFYLIKFPAFKLVLLTVILGLIASLLLALSRQRRFIPHLLPVKGAGFARSAVSLQFSRELKYKFWGIILNLLLILTAGYFLINKTDAYEMKTASWRLPASATGEPSERLVKSYNSFFGNISVTEKGGQFNFYQNGILSAPTGDFQTAEESIHLPFLFSPLETVSLTGQRVLIIGSAWNGFIKEALKYPGLEIFYVEPDPEFLPAVYNFLPLEFQKDLKNPRVKIINQDAFSYLKEKKEKFDFILSNLPPPSTYQTNRYYTKEFFGLARERLTSKGIFAATLPYYQENLQNPNINRFLGSIFDSFSQVFTNNVIIPAQKLFFIGLKDEGLKWQAEILKEDFQKRNLGTRFLSPSYIEYLLTNERRGQIIAGIKAVPAHLNTTRTPLAVIYQITSQVEIVQAQMSRLLNWCLANRWFILGLAALLPILFIYPTRRKTGVSQLETKVKVIAVFASSLSLILEVVLIFIWQLTVGYVFHQISLIISLVMMGIFLANLQLFLKPPRDRIRVLKLFLFLLFSLAIFLATFILNLDNFRLSVIKAVILSLSLVSGYLAGGIYPLINHLYLEKRPAPKEEVGKIYGLELIGGAVLLVIFSLFILPFFGLLAFAGFLIYWMFLSHLLVFRLREA